MNRMLFFIQIILVYLLKLGCVVICFFFNTNPGQPNKVADKIKESS